MLEHEWDGSVRIEWPSDNTSFKMSVFISSFEIRFWKRRLINFTKEGRKKNNGNKFKSEGQELQSVYLKYKRNLSLYSSVCE